MKYANSLILSALFIFAFIKPASAQSDTDQCLAEEARIFAEMTSGALGVLDAMLEVQAAGHAYFPDDHLLNARNNSYVRYAQQFAREELDFDGFIKKLESRKERFNQALSERNRSEQAQRQAAWEAENARVERQREVTRNYLFLKGLGDAFRNMGR